ncbi:rod shape-determining protein MreC [Aurantiacibacter atlanticus]|uniref:Cell shape-determining protein MreC n=1 Tax=Aurantiacibacter atlanticus TaxID=1648404 RepID=A0A0H4VHH1_9SPHN|nr:rod shape-determining protein MreC [Aurantiacibacter atlanticus]AKQ42321.1 rod shape-determining protein MreC [Aurantiacibacter atlanticus]MDF1834806.1 rod shape-determining protein MreC [Alteraurantiacibacter sp. bin_em_oilr2.035]
MAPPSAQTTGSNKKAQLGRFAGYVFASAGAVIGALLLLVSLLRPDAFYGLRSMATDAAYPIGEAGAVGRSGSRSFFEAIAGYYQAGSKNAELEQEIAIARVRLAEAAALEQENARLKAVLGLKEDENEPIAVGRLIGSSSSSLRRFGYLSAGRNDGVEVGMPVTSPMGLVGRILETGRSTSRVLLLTDPESIVPVRRATDDVVAFAEGRADGSLRIRLINLGINPLKEGDIFVTSGAGGLFTPGVAVAMVTRITDDGAIASLLSNPAATDYVVVHPFFEPEAITASQAPLRTEQPVEDD